MKDFQFQKFTIRQSKQVFRVGTDALLLGALCSIQNARKGLEIGTGTGVVSLMLAQRNPSLTITGIEIDPEAHALTRRNFENSPYSDRLQSLCMDMNDWHTDEKFDLIFSNPPFYEVNEQSHKDKIARQQATLNYDQLISKTTTLLTENGIFSVIIPKNDEEFFINKTQAHRLNLIRKINIHGMLGSKAKRLVLEFSFRSPIAVEEERLILEKSPRVFSEQYLELTKDFHVFKNQ